MNVYEAALSRLEILFKEFEHILIAFSGGKDSGVMLNLCLQYMQEHGIQRKVGVVHIDYEAQYEMTTQYVDAVLASQPELIEVYRVCMPLRVPCATSMHQKHWTPWDTSERDIWVRDMPPNGIGLHNHSFDFWKPGMTDYDFQERFGTWYARLKGAKKVACLIGIRTQESMNRWRAIHSDRNYRKWGGHAWTKDAGIVCNAYPIYDWRTEDIWTANARFGWEYNRLYDLMYQAGVPIHKMRVASPFIEQGIDSLKLYRAIDPDNWGRLVGRVNGVNFSNIYGGTTAMGWHRIKLPRGHSWESYMYFLLSTLPEDARRNYLSKLATSIRLGGGRGGCLDDSTISKLSEAGVPIEVEAGSNYRTDKRRVKMPYLDAIDIPETRLIPTYKRMCICIMKNDHLCKYMGFSQTKKETEKRRAVMAKYQSI